MADASAAALPVGDRFSVCQHVLRLGDLRRDVEAASRAGARAISVNASDHGDTAPADRPKIIADAGLAVSSYIDPGLMLLGPQMPELDRVARATDDAAAVGAPCFLFIAGALPSAGVDAADGHLVEALGRIAERMAGSGVRPMLEPLHPIARDLSYVHTLRHALSITAQVDAAGVVVDTGASWWERDVVGECAANLDSILAVQITDVSAERMAARTYARVACSCESAVPVAALVRAFVAAGYTGWFEHEVLTQATPEERFDILRGDREWFGNLFGTAGAGGGA
jgi:sugar phosphate isomerase/epimerase